MQQKEERLKKFKDQLLDLIMWYDDHPQENLKWFDRELIALIAVFLETWPAVVNRREVSRVLMETVKICMAGWRRVGNESKRRKSYTETEKTSETMEKDKRTCVVRLYLFFPTIPTYSIR